MLTHRPLWQPMLIAAVLVCLLPGVQARGQEGDGAPAAPQGPPPATVRVGEVKAMELSRHFGVVGRLQELRHTSVAVETAGRVVELNAEEGDKVVAGQTVLARIDDTWAKIDLADAEARVAEATASIAAAQAQLDQSSRDLSYLVDLQKAGSAKPKEVDDMRTQVEANQALLQASRASLRSAEAAVSRAKTSIERLEVKAPFDGVVVNKLTEVGQWLDQGEEVATIISRGEIDAVVDVPETLVTQLSLQQAIEVRVDALGKELPGKVTAIVPRAATGARTFPVKIRLQDGDGLLKPGMSVTASLPVSETATVLTVPRDAVENTVQGSRVWVALPKEGSPMPQGIPVMVNVLFGSGDRYAVAPVSPMSPLNDNMQVVTEGSERLFPTQPLVILPPDAVSDARQPAASR